jgi:hypothetical protein
MVSVNKNDVDRCIQKQHDLMLHRARLAFLFNGEPQTVPKTHAALIDVLIKYALSEVRAGSNWKIHSFATALSCLRGPDVQVAFKTLEEVDHVVRLLTWFELINTLEPIIKKAEIECI